VLLPLPPFVSANCSKHVIQLEAILKRKVAQLDILEAENARLKQKERALQRCILGFEGGVETTRAVLEGEAVAGDTVSYNSWACDGDLASVAHSTGQSQLHSSDAAKCTANATAQVS
jgi:hypothetical protein